MNGPGGENGPVTDYDEVIAKSYPMVTILKHEEQEQKQKRVSARAAGERAGVVICMVVLRRCLLADITP